MNPTIILYTVYMSETNYDLADFTRAKIKEKDLNYRLVAERSDGLITHSAVYDIISRRSIDQKISTLKGLALGLSEPEELIFAIARGVPPKIEKIANERFAKIVEGYSKLSQIERNSLEPLLLAIEKTIELSKPSKPEKKKIIYADNLGKVGEEKSIKKKKAS